MRRLAATLTLVLLFSASAFGDDTAPERLRIGVDPAYPPFSDIDEVGRLIGFDIDIALALCVRMEAECTFVRQEWEGLIPELLAGSFDAIVSSMSITEKRRRLVAFTERYYSRCRNGARHQLAPLEPVERARTFSGDRGLIRSL